MNAIAAVYEERLLVDVGEHPGDELFACEHGAIVRHRVAVGRQRYVRRLSRVGHRSATDLGMPRGGPPAHPSCARNIDPWSEKLEPSCPSEDFRLRTLLPIEHLGPQMITFNAIEGSGKRA